jgi:hypothetical protein
MLQMTSGFMQPESTLQNYWLTLTPPSFYDKQNSRFVIHYAYRMLLTHLCALICVE